MTYTRPVVSTLPAGTALSRYIIASAKAKGDPLQAAVIAGEHFRSTPQVEELFHKAAVAPGSTSNTFAPLSQYGIAAEFFQLLQSASVLGRLQGVMRRVAFRSKSSRDAAAGIGTAWVGEGFPKPTAAGVYDQLTQDFFTRASIVVLTQEEMRFDPIAEASVRTALIAGVARDLDGQFLDPNVSATSAHPAGVTNGATAVTSTGVTASALVADFSSLLAAIQTAADSLRLIMRPKVYHRILTILAGVGLSQPPNSLFGIPVIASSTVPDPATSPASNYVILVDAAAIAYSLDDTVDLSVSREASLQMSDSPSSSAANVVSLMQDNLIGIRAFIGAAWQRAFENSVAYMTVAL